MLVYLVGDAKCVLYFEQPTIFLARRYLNIMLLTSLLNSFQELEDFVILTDSVITCMYLRASLSFSKNPPTYVFVTRRTSVITPWSYLNGICSNCWIFCGILLCGFLVPSKSLLNQKCVYNWFGLRYHEFSDWCTFYFKLTYDCCFNL